MSTEIGRVRTFFLATVCWTWACWIPVVLSLRGRGATDMLEAPGWFLLLAYCGGLGPSLMALLLTSRGEGRAGVKRLLGGLKLWRASPWVHLVVWLGPSLFLLAAMLMAPAVSARLGSPVWERLRLAPLALLAAIPFGPLGEELGWRGYALPRLQGNYSALASSVMIGLVWTAWHAPFFWAPAGTTISGHPITAWAITKYLLMLVGLSIVFTWIVNSSRGSVGLAVAFHATWNSALVFLPFPERSSDAALFLEELSAVAVWILAVGLVALFGHRRLASVDLRASPRR